MEFSPIEVLKDAQKAVPAVRYAAGISGVAAVVAIIAGFQIDFRIAVFGTILVLGLMFVLVIFGALAEHAHAGVAIVNLALFAAWCFVLLTIATSFLLMTSYFFAWPKGIDSYLPGPRKQGYVDYKRSVDFSGLKYGEGGKKIDRVIFEDIVDFSNIPTDGSYIREFQMPPGATLEVFDLVSGTEVTPPFKQGGQQVYGHAVFKVDRYQKQARLKWVYENAHGGNREGVGFSSSDILVRNVSVTYKLPEGKAFCGNREFKPVPLENKCRRRSDGFECDELNTSSEFRELWSWNVWSDCVN